MMYRTKYSTVKPLCLYERILVEQREKAIDASMVKYKPQPRKMSALEQQTSIVMRYLEGKDFTSIGEIRSFLGVNRAWNIVLIVRTMKRLGLAEIERGSDYTRMRLRLTEKAKQQIKLEEMDDETAMD